MTPEIGDYLAKARHALAEARAVMGIGLEGHHTIPSPVTIAHAAPWFHRPLIVQGSYDFSDMRTPSGRNTYHLRMHIMRIIP